jgi:hypothetical protein
MQLPSAKAEEITGMLEHIMQHIQPLTVSERSADNLADNPAQIMASLQQLRDIVASNNDNPGELTASEVTEIGEYSMQLLANASQILQRLNDTELQQYNGVLAVSMALWTGAQGGQINMLEPLVDTLAWLANHLQDEPSLGRLSDILGELMSACSLAISSDLDNTNPGRPWRVLNINRGIVATRSHDTELMREAFDTLVHNLPQDAASFFDQGMSEMDRLGYPDHVRKIVQEYANRHPVANVIH